MMNRRRINLVELYLNGRMSAQDIQAFHKQLEVDPKLRELLQEEQKIEQALRRDRQSIPSIGTQRLEQMLQSSARDRRGGGRGPLDPNGSASKAPRMMEMSLVERARRWLTSWEFRVAMAGVGVVLVAFLLLQRNELNIVEPAAAHGSPAIPGTPGVTSDSLLFHSNGTAPGGAPALADSFTSSVPGGTSDGVMLNGERSGASDPRYMDENEVVRGRATTRRAPKQKEKEGARPVTPPASSEPAVSPEDAVQEMLKRMEREEREGKVRQETTDSVRAHIKVKQKD